MRSCLCFQLFGEDVSEKFREAGIFSLIKELVTEGPFLLGESFALHNGRRLARSPAGYSIGVILKFQYPGFSSLWEPLSV